MLKSISNLIVLPLVWLLLIVLSIVLYLLSLLPRTFSVSYYHSLSRFWCRVFVRALDTDLKLVHKNTRPLPEHYILVANHPSAFEDFAIPALFDIYPLAKTGVRDWLLLGRISDYAGTIYVERKNAESRHSALQSLIETVQNGKNIVIFPEGGCHGRRIYHTFHTGAFDISLQSGIPVVPVFLHYIDQDAFEWKNESLPLKLWQIFKTSNKLVNYYVYDAYLPSDFDDKESFAKHVHEQYLLWQQEYLD